MAIFTRFERSIGNFRPPNRDWVIYADAFEQFFNVDLCIFWSIWTHNDFNNIAAFAYGQPKRNVRNGFAVSRPLRYLSFEQSSVAENYQTNFAFSCITWM